MPENALQLDVVSFDSHNAKRIPDLDSEGSAIHDTDRNYRQGYHMASSEPDSIENPVIDTDINQPVICDEYTTENTTIGAEPNISSAKVVEFPLQRCVYHMSVLGWLIRGLPSEATKKLRWLLNNLKDIFPEIYHEVVVDSQEFTRAEILAWLDIVGDVVPPEGTDIDALMAEID